MDMSTWGRIKDAAPRYGFGSTTVHGECSADCQERTASPCVAMGITRVPNDRRWLCALSRSQTAGSLRRQRSRHRNLDKQKQGSPTDDGEGTSLSGSGGGTNHGHSSNRERTWLQPCNVK
ncbi:hypothetical protein ACP70R_037793 [Stipagrostis hirtigluma subsp. patula]